MRHSAIHTAQVFTVVVVASSDRLYVPEAVDACPAEVILFAEENFFLDQVFQE
jgi:hypothetical protein